MTQEKSKQLIPGKSILKTKINGVEKDVLFKFFLCKTGDDFDGYWLCVTEDLTNPEPRKQLDTDFETYYNLCEIVKFE